MIRCPQCGAEIQPTWDWCQECGFDPEGLKPKGWMPAGTAPGAARPSFGPSAAPPPRAPAPGPGFYPAGPGATGRPGGPTAPGAMPPGYGAGPYTAPGFSAGPPSGRSRSTVATLFIVLGSIAGAFVLLIVVLVGAVTLLGKSSTSKFSSIGSAIDDPPGLNASPTTAPAWPTWTSPDGHTTIKFPGTPRELPSPPLADGLTYGPDMMYDTTTGAYEFGYLDVTFGRYFKDPPAALSSIVDGLGKSSNGTIASRTPTTFVGMPAIEFNGTGDLAGSKADIRGLVVIADKRLYLIITYNEPGAVPPDWDQFVNSWRIV